MTEAKLERIEAIVGEYEELLSEKADLGRKAEENKEAIKAKADELCQAISDAGLKNVSCGDYTYTPGVQHNYYLKKDEDLPEGVDDKFAVFEADAYLEGLVKKDINWRRLQTAMHELEETEEGIPEEVLAVLNVNDEFGIQRRKTDVGGRDKVAAALRKRRSGNA